MSTGGISWCRACVGLTGPRNIYCGRFGSGGGVRRVMRNERERKFDFSPTAICEQHFEPRVPILIENSNDEADDDPKFCSEPSRKTGERSCRGVSSYGHSKLDAPVLMSPIFFTGVAVLNLPPLTW